MKKIIPFIPVVGIILAYYFTYEKNESVGLDDSNFIFWASALVQIVSISYIYLHFICQII